MGSLDSLHSPPKWALQISAETADGVHVLVLAGRVGHASSPGLAEAIARVLTGRNSRLVIDFTGVDYVSSAGLEVLGRAVASGEAAGGALVVTGLCEPVRLVFDLAGILSTMACEASRAQAIERARGTPPPAKATSASPQVFPRTRPF